MERRIVLLVALSLAALPCWAQTSSHGTIFGNVADATGAVIPGAQLTVTNESTGLARSATANAEGDYRVDFLPPGDYQIVVKQPGFDTTRLTDITLLVGQALRVDAQLEVGVVTEEVTVSASVTMLNTKDASRGEVIEERFIHSLPLNGREFLALASLVPGAVPGSRPMDNPVRAKGDQETGYAIGYSGARGSYNSYFLDGGQNTAAEHNNMVSSPPVDAIREFRIETSSYSARYGQAGGAIISVVTKAGTNAYHGSLYEYHRNKALDSLPYFYQGTREEYPNTLWNQFGGAIGGPIWKDKTFFFGSAEFFRHSSAGKQLLSFAPTAAERVGDVRNSVTPWGPVELHDPWTGAVIPSGILPDNLKHPIGEYLMSLWPEPNYPANPLLNLRLWAVTRNSTDKYLGRIDHNFGSRDFLSGTFNYGDYDIGLPSYTDIGAKVFSQHDRTLNLTYTHIFNPTLVNVLTSTFAQYFSGDRFKNDDRNYGIEWGLDPSVNEGQNFPNIILWTSGLSMFQIGGTPDSKNLERAGSIRDDLSWQKGSHVLQMGGLFWRQRYNWQWFSGGTTYYMNLNDGIPGLWFLFGVTGSAFTNLLAAINNFQQVGFGGGQYNRFQRDTYALYFHDDWKVNSRFTLNLGVRWEYERPFETLDGKLMALNYDTGMVRYAKGAPGLDVVTFPHETDGPTLTYQSHKAIFMPRFGFAFRPFKSDKTVVRGGYGIFFNSEPAYTMRNGAFATPFGGVVSYFSKFIVGWPDGDHLRTLDQRPYGIETQLNNGPILGWLTTDREYPRAYMQHWNLTVGHDFGGDLIAEVAYVGNRGVNLNGIQSPLSSFSPELSARVQANYPGWTTAIHTKGFSSNYNGLQAKLQKTLSHGLTFLASYTWSHALADASNDVWYENTILQSDEITGAPVGYERFQANAGFDVRQRLSIAGVYELPFGSGRKWGSDWKGALDKLVGGWNLNFIYEAQTGFPFSVYVDPFYVLADRICDGNLPKGERTFKRWFDYTCFPTHYGTTPGVAIPGNSAPNVIRGPGIDDLDLGVHKITALTDTTSLEFRVESFNIWNNPQPTTANNDLNWFFNSATGAELTNAQPQRQIQFALRFSF